MSGHLHALHAKLFKYDGENILTICRKGLGYCTGPYIGLATCSILQFGTKALSHLKFSPAGQERVPHASIDDSKYNVQQEHQPLTYIISDVIGIFHFEQLNCVEISAPYFINWFKGTSILSPPHLSIHKTVLFLLQTLMYYISLQSLEHKLSNDV